MTESNFKTDIIITLKNNLSATFHDYKIERNNLYALSELSYNSYCFNKRSLVIDDIPEELKSSLNNEGLIAEFIQLYYDKIYHRVAYYIHAKTNGIPLDNIDYTMTCDNAVRAIGPNDETFSNNPKLGEEINNALLKALTI